MLPTVSIRLLTEGHHAFGRYPTRRVRNAEIYGREMVGMDLLGLYNGVVRDLIQVIRSKPVESRISVTHACGCHGFDVALRIIRLVSFQSTVSLL